MLWDASALDDYAIQVRDGRRVLISPHSVRGIDRTNRLVHLDADRRKVEHSPPYDPSKTVDGAYDQSFLTFYGIKWVQP